MELVPDVHWLVCFLVIKGKHAVYTMIERMEKTDCVHNAEPEYEVPTACPAFPHREMTLYVQLGPHPYLIPAS